MMWLDNLPNFRLLGQHQHQGSLVFLPLLVQRVDLNATKQHGMCFCLKTEAISVFSAFYMVQACSSHVCFSLERTFEVC